mmetsp:Transcript_4090/g.6339  ORF Transcript_4090/g.6339 Transcript_4090/m.6339 type:complete len:913 (+) Transcript_4090:60-2798(+)
MNANWLRQASMRRLHSLVVDKKEILGNNLVFCDDINPQDLEPSGLSALERQHLKSWVNGEQSGRQCLLALLECHQSQNCKKSEKPKEVADHLVCGAPKRYMQFDILSKSINLPEHFLCDSGFMCEHVFSKSPSAVLKEAMQLLSKYAMEKTSSALTLDQINLALKQIRVDNLHADRSIKKNSVSESHAVGDENTENNSQTDVERSRGEGGKYYKAEMYRLRIMIELLRIHIVRTSRTDETIAPPDEETTEEEQLPPRPEHKIITSHLDLSLEDLVSEAKKLSAEDLDAVNRVFQPYVSELMALKSSLSTQLQEIDDSRAFLSLGVSKTSSEADIKKAYHSKAVKLHPDKPGGDKEKFQKLHDVYQDVLKSSREEAAVQAAALKASNTPASRAEVELVQDLLNEMESALEQIKLDSSTCGRLGQLSLRWQKKIASASKLPFPRAFKKIYKMSSEDVIGKDGNGVQVCSALLAVEPVERIGVNMQKVISSAMGVLKSGDRYGSVAGGDLQFMKRIEYAAQCGIAVQQGLPSLAPPENQLELCLARAERSMEFAIEDEDVHNVLTQMLCTVFHTRALALGTNADAVVSAAISAAELILATRDIIKRADEELLAQARRAACMADIQMDYCAEDLAQMAAAREKERQVHQEAQEKKEKEAKEQKDAGNEMEYLTDQIHNLQLQLRLQYVEALQSLNAETRAMQKRICSEIGVDVRAGCSQQDTKVHKMNGGSVPNTKDSLLSLLAEFVDAACAGLRNELSACDAQDAPATTELSALLDKHLGWMSSLSGLSLSDSIASEQQQTDDCSEQVSDPDESSDCAHEEAAEKCGRPSDASVKLALLPDYRAKIFWMAALVDDKSVEDMIRNELSQRLRRDCTGSVKDEQRVDVVNKLTDEFCSIAAKGVFAAAQEIQGSGRP